MNSRMEKYENGNNPTSRTIKNKNLSFPRLDKRKAFEEVERLKEKRI